jgi:hypothetical protein
MDGVQFAAGTNCIVVLNLRVYLGAIAREFVLTTVWILHGNYMIGECYEYVDVSMG